VTSEGVSRMLASVHFLDGTVCPRQ